MVPGSKAPPSFHSPLHRPRPHCTQTYSFKGGAHTKWSGKHGVGKAAPCHKGTAAACPGWFRGDCTHQRRQCSQHGLRPCSQELWRRHGAQGRQHSRTQFQHTLHAASPSGTRQAFPRTCRQVLAAEQRKQRRERDRHVTRTQPANPAEKYHVRPTVSTQVLATGETIIYFKPKAANTILTIRNFPRDNQNSASSQNRVTGTRFPLTHETAKTDKIHETMVSRHWTSGMVIAEEKRPQ